MSHRSDSVSHGENEMDAEAQLKELQKTIDSDDEDGMVN